MRSPTRSSRRCSAPISRASCAKASCAASSRTARSFNLLGGEPEYLDPLKDEAPVGWYVTGYPWYAIDTPEHKNFLEAYQAKFNDYPRLGSVVGYSAVIAAAAAIRKAGSTDPEKIVAALAGLTFDVAVRHRSRSARSTISRRWARTSGAPRSRTARA